MYFRPPLLDTTSGKPFFSRIWIMQMAFHSLLLRERGALVRCRITYEVFAYLREVYAYSLWRLARVAELGTVDTA